MAMVKRHWKLATFNALLLVAAGILVVLRLAHTSTPALAETPPSSGLSALAYTRIADLREWLSLTNHDLAAADCTELTAEQILLALIEWYQQHHSTWNARIETQRLAVSNLREARRKIALGPRDEQLIAQLESLEQAVVSATDETEQLLGSAIAPVQALLSSQQESIWNAARANRLVPLRYRFVPNLTEDDVDSLRATLSKYGGTSNTTVQAEQARLGTAGVEAMEAARTNVRERLGGVLAAESAVLPLPEDLRGTQSTGE